MFITLVASYESTFYLQTIALRVEEENYARLRLVRLQAREKELRDDVSGLQEKLAAEQRSFTHTTNQQVRCVLFRVKGMTGLNASSPSL